MFLFVIDLASTLVFHLCLPFSYPDSKLRPSVFTHRLRIIIFIKYLGRTRLFWIFYFIFTYKVIYSQWSAKLSDICALSAVESEGVIPGRKFHWEFPEGDRFDLVQQSQTPQGHPLQPGARACPVCTICTRRNYIPFPFILTFISH